MTPTADNNEIVGLIEALERRVSALEAKVQTLNSSVAEPVPTSPTVESEIQ